MKSKNTVIRDILEEYKTIWAIEYSYKLLGWDLATYMPKYASENHALTMGKLSVLHQQKLLDSKIVNLVKKGFSQTNLTQQEKSILRILKRQIDEKKKLPKEFLEEWSQETAKAQNAWEKAKQTEDYNLFKPHLKKVINLNLQKAEYIGYKNHPLDALLDQFEEGLTQNQVEQYFNSIKPFLVELLTYIKSSKNFNAKNEVQQIKYNESDAIKINEKILELFGEDKNNLRLDVSTHPFTQGFSSKQARITTWYHKNDINRTIAATIHEFGHAIYELQSSPELDYTPIAGGISLGIHESQSRFWENFIGRNKNFIKLILPSINIALDKSVTLESFYRYANNVKPSLIRVEADEVTYHMHILIRYEMEKGFMDKTINADNAVDAWNSMYQKYLGVKPKKLSEGILQDIHWSMGAIGYFPTYSTGTVLSATWKQLLENKIGPIDKLLLQKDGIKKIKDWQKQNIHKYGSTYNFNEIIRKNTKKDFSIEPWKNYLTQKYKQIY